jgi:hypothetical protein
MEIINISKSKKIDDLSSDNDKSIVSPSSIELYMIISGSIISIISTILDPDNDISNDQSKSSESSNNHGYNNSSLILYIGISEESILISGIRWGSYIIDGLSKLDI